MIKFQDKYIKSKDPTSIFLVSSLFSIVISSLYYDRTKNELACLFIFLFSMYPIFILMVSFISFIRERVRTLLIIKIIGIPIAGLSFEYLFRFITHKNIFTDYAFIIFVSFCLSINWIIIKNECRKLCIEKQYHVANYLVDKLKLTSNYIAVIYGIILGLLKLAENNRVVVKIKMDILLDDSSMIIQLILVTFVIGVFRTLLDHIIFNVNLHEGKKYKNH